jgi:osmotically-inducible protein OsmY
MSSMSPRALIALGMSLVLLGPMGARPAFSESQEKESAPEKSTPGPQHPPAASESQPTPHKPSTEAKPPKVESSTDHKEGAPEKPASRHQHPPAASDSQAAPHKPSAEAKPQIHTTPPTKTDPPSDKEKDPSEIKEKDPVVKKPLGSLILSVKLALMGDSRLFRYEIEAEDDQQTITLTGRVCSEDDKSAATEVAQAVQGVKTVVNKLALEKDLAKTLLKKQDETLTAMIKERFAKSATLKAANFEVKTEEGVVQLNGTVRFQVIALEAAETARQVPGVRAVNTEKIRLEGES